MGMGRESGRGRDSAWGSGSGWAGRMDRQGEWMGRECGWEWRVDWSDRVERAGTVDGAGRVPQLKVFTESLRTLSFITLCLLL